ncbi:GNAT family N-acetyltransferase [Enterococcus sp. 669A]|uniref:GNAT family N-acetyltransferase n=1 Tax=Candidatus Enterococcus moelleringii TaxID=2815325 RepID=A0ABS3LEV8_9ENTE|nr:GNAT family N-acetyltransferase [Enterococcus sp. 669A]MBO1308159.1 GNAT family N-acetyltransferase [Enterococcus sp. 669A]
MKLPQNQATLQAVTNLIEYAFNKQQPIIDDSLFLSRYQHADCFGTFHHEQLSSLVMVNHFQAKVFAATVPMAGIGYVASYPEFRGSGGVSEIMQEILADLYESGVVISQLAPFSQRFYRQFGYENTSQQKKYRIPAAAFAHVTSEKAGEIKRGTWDETQKIIRALYQEALTNDQVGTVAREAWWWERLQEYYPHRFYAVCYDQNQQVQGYLIYRLQGDTFLVDELVYLNGFALRKLVTYMKAHVSSFSWFAYAAPVHECLEVCFAEQEALEISVAPYMMSRIINLPQLFSHLPIDADELIVEVTEDQQCPWNQGIWQLKAGECQRVEGLEPDIRGNIHAWTELILGNLSLEEGCLLDKFEVNNQKIMAAFPKGKQSFYDYF